jgi:predicted kinase
MSQPKLILLCGLPASGKSTFTKVLSTYEDAIVLSSDDLRLELFNDINHQDDNGKVFEELYKRANQNIKNGKSVIIDATNTSSKRRMSTINQFSNCIKVAYYFNTPFEECVERDSQRDRTVGKRVIDRMYRQMQIPTYVEGWDVIHLVHENQSHDLSLSIRQAIEPIITSKSTYKQIFNYILQGIPLFKDILELPHDSKYHSLSVSRHTFHVWKEIQQSYANDLELLWAALLHDTGKADCKEFKDGSRYANFIGHEFVSGQLACQFLHWLGYDDGFILRVVELVQWHMRLMGAGDSEKAIKKLKDFVGDEVFEKLSILYDADLKAK